MADMAGRVTNCARFQRQMSDAAFDSLPADALAAFNAHVRDCPVCRGEFHRVQTMLQAINRTLSAGLAAEPSERLVANVRRNVLQDINAQPHRVEVWRHWWTWAAAAGVCATFAILLFVVRTSRRLNPPLHDSATVRTSAPPILKPAVHPRLNASTEAAGSRPRRSTLAFARHASLRASPAKAAAPEIIVQPGQMQAILRFATAMQRGQIDGAQFLAAQKKANEPLEIKPLPITPLKIEPLDADSAAPNSGNGENSTKSFVSGRAD